MCVLDASRGGGCPWTRHRRVYSTQKREINHLFLNTFSTFFLDNFCEFFLLFFPALSLSLFWVFRGRSLQTPMSHWRPLQSAWLRNIHPLNGTCHGGACPRTKDNCDLDKHWGENIKAKVKSSFSSSVLRFTYNTTGTKTCSYLRFLKGDVMITRFFFLLLFSFFYDWWREEDSQQWRGRALLLLTLTLLLTERKEELQHESCYKTQHKQIIILIIIMPGREKNKCIFYILSHFVSLFIIIFSLLLLLLVLLPQVQLFSRTEGLAE